MAAKAGGRRTSMKTIVILLVVMVLGAFAIMFLTPPRTPEGQAELERVAETPPSAGRSAALDNPVAGAPTATSAEGLNVAQRNMGNAIAEEQAERNEEATENREP